MTCYVVNCSLCPRALFLQAQSHIILLTRDITHTFRRCPESLFSYIRQHVSCDYGIKFNSGSPEITMEKSSIESCNCVGGKIQSHNHSLNYLVNRRV